MTVKPKLMAFDLDGTLLDSEKRVPDSAVKALKRAREAGVIVIPCTGRPVSGIMDCVLPLLTPPGYAVCSNGTAVVRLDTGEYLGLWPLNRREIESVRTLAAHQDMLCEFYYHGKSYITAEGFSRAEEFVYPEMREYFYASRVACADVEAFLDEHGTEIEKINLLFKDEPTRLHIRDALGGVEGVYVTTSAKNNLEITDTASDKGRAVLFLTQHLGISAEETVGFGDSDNDLLMLRSVGRAVAMGNATPAVKAAASMVTASNDDNGVAKAIALLLNGWE